MKFYLSWEMDGMQIEILEIKLIHKDIIQSEQHGFIGTYIECLKFIYFNLSGAREQFMNYYTINVDFYCPEGKYVITQNDIKKVIHNRYPEIFI